MTRFILELGLLALLKPTPGAAWTQVIPSEFFHEILLYLDNSMPSLYFSF